METANNPDSSEADAERELAARRREMEDAFDAKLRDLKAQERRRLEALRKEQAEWQEMKRVQGKELADKAERLRRQEESLRQETQRVAATRDELQSRKTRVETQEQASVPAAARIAKLEARLAKSESRSRSANRFLLWLTVVAFVSPLAWVAVGWNATRGASVLLAGACLLVALVLTLWRATMDAESQ